MKFENSRKRVVHWTWGDMRGSVGRAKKGGAASVSVTAARFHISAPHYSFPKIEWMDRWMNEWKYEYITAFKPDIASESIM